MQPPAPTLAVLVASFNARVLEHLLCARCYVRNALTDHGESEVIGQRAAVNLEKITRI